MNPKTQTSGDGNNNKNNDVIISNGNPIEELGDRIAGLTNDEAKELHEYLDYFYSGWEI